MEPLFCNSTVNYLLRNVKASSDSKHKTILILNDIMVTSGNGMTTRQIADKFDLSIYTARNILLKLEAENFVQRLPDNKGYRWFASSMQNSDDLEGINA
jgi:DNA-binding MarR family transcriptional regulator